MMTTMTICAAKARSRSYFNSSEGLGSGAYIMGYNASMTLQNLDNLKLLGRTENPPSDLCAIPNS